MIGTYPDLAIVIETWDKLPEAVRAGIVAMVTATTAKWGQQHDETR
jgi:hypothetical protein